MYVTFLQQLLDVFLSKIVCVRVTLHGWYGEEKPPSITRLSEGTSQLAGLKESVLFAVQLQCPISCFKISRMIDSTWTAAIKLRTFNTNLTWWGVFRTLIFQHVGGTWICWKTVKCILKDNTFEDLDEVLQTFYPAGNGEHRHQSVAQPRTLSLSTDRMWSSSHYRP